jgi:transcriptional regulator with XRE-family HTH domain
MNSFNEYFKVALKHSLNKRGAQLRLSSKSGISHSQLSEIMKGVKSGSEETRRRIAEAVGYSYEEFLERGRAIVEGKDPDSIYEDIIGMTEDNLRERGFLTIPFSDNMRLAAGSGGTPTIDITESINTSTIVIHGPSLGRTSSRNLQAFRVGGDSMEPVIAEGGIVLADLSENNPSKLREGKIYVLCWEMSEGECAVKYLRWADKGKYISITSPDIYLHPPIIKKLNDIQLVGRVIWSWRDHR